MEKEHNISALRNKLSTIGEERKMGLWKEGDSG
jgi:hypothetical protein